MYRRDYKKLEADELKAKKRLNELNQGILPTNDPSEIEEKNSIKLEYPALRHFDSLFPNNFINPDDLIKQNDDLTQKLKLFKEKIDNKGNTERDVLNYIRTNEAFFIIGSIVKKYTDWGHHDLYVFPEFQLGTSYKVDYLVAGKNSFGYSFMFIELENIYSYITIKSGEYGSTIRKGISQVDDWKIWLEKNYSNLKDVFTKKLGANKTLPAEFFEFDSTKITYAVVGGRREDYEEKTYRLRGNFLDNSKIHVLHYDNLYDAADLVLASKKY